MSSHPEVPTNETPLWRGPLAVILVTTFLSITGFGLILPILPYYAEAYGATGMEIGLLFTLFSAVQFITSPMFGAVSDRIGRRQLIMWGILIQIVGYLVMGFAVSLGILFLSRFIAGVGAGNVSVSQAYVADVTPGRDRTRAYGLVGAAFGAGFLFGPVLGGLLHLIDSRAPAFGSAALLAINLVFAFFALPESLSPERRVFKPLLGQLNPVGVLVPLARRPALRAPLLAIFLLNVALAAFQAIFAVFAFQRFAFGPTVVAEVLAASGLANIVVQAGILPKLSNHFADATLVVAGSVVMAAGQTATGLASAGNALWVSAPVMSGGYSLSRGPLTSLMTKLVAPTEQGMVNGGVQSVISLASIVGPIWAGFVYESLGTAAPFWTSAVMALLAAAALLVRLGSLAPAPAAATEPAPSYAAAPDVARGAESPLPATLGPDLGTVVEPTQPPPVAATIETGGPNG